MKRAHRPPRPWLAAAALALAAAGAPSLDAQEPSAASADDRPELAVSGHLDRETAGSGDLVSFWVEFTNQTAEPISELEIVRLDHPGLEPAGGCWRDGAPVCLAGGGGPPPAALEPGERAIFTADLRPGERGGTVALTALYRWRSGAGPLRRGVATVGAVELAAGWRDLVWWVELLKDLAWPLVLLFLGWLLKSSEQRRAEIQQTWTQMLQKSHENAERYYMPISSQVLRLRRELSTLAEAGRDCSEDAPAKAAEAQDRLCQELLVLLRRQRELAEKIGGWYFKSRPGENLVAYTWRCFQVIAQQRLERKSLDRVLDGLSVEDSPAHVGRKLKTMGRDGERIRQSCRDWVVEGDFREVFCLLGLLEVLLDFEMNRCYERWYGDKEAFPEENFAGAAEEFRSWATKQRLAPEGAAKIAAQLAEYPAEVRRQQGRLARWKGRLAEWQDWVDRQGAAAP